jgi:hypothetical protein
MLGYMIDDDIKMWIFVDDGMFDYIEFDMLPDS